MASEQGRNSHHSEEKDIVVPLSDLLDLSSKIHLDAKKGSDRDSLAWMKDELDKCSSRNSSDQLSNDSDDPSIIASRRSRRLTK